MVHVKKISDLSGEKKKNNYVPSRRPKSAIRDMFFFFFILLIEKQQCAIFLSTEQKEIYTKTMPSP